MSDISAVHDPGPWADKDFAIAVLRGLGAPTSDGNVAFLLSWFRREGVNHTYNNPLATTLKYGSYTNINSVGVKHYSDPSTGVAATVKTLQGSRYSGIVSDLKANNPTSAAHNHPDEFKAWSGGGYDHIDMVGDTVGNGSTAAGGGSFGSGTDAPPKNATTAQAEAWIRQNEPLWSGYLDIPELHDIFVKATQDAGNGSPWSSDKVTAAVQNTNWWKNNGKSARDFLYLQQTDPTTAEQQVQAEMARIKPMLAQEGSDVSLRAIAVASLTYGWNAEQLQENLAGHAQFDLAHGGLKQGSSPDLEATKLAKIARTEYFVPMDQQTVGQWAVDIFAGKKTEEQFTDYLGTLAEARFPGLKEKGLTPGQYMSGIIGTVANELEVNPADINPLDPKYSPLISVVDDKGQVRPMSTWEAVQWARSQPGYLKTKGANDNAASLAQTLGQMFGSVA